MEGDGGCSHGSYSQEHNKYDLLLVEEQKPNYHVQTFDFLHQNLWKKNISKFHCSMTGAWKFYRMNINSVFGVIITQENEHIYSS